jgi:hypothetical protein
VARIYRAAASRENSSAKTIGIATPIASIDASTLVVMLNRCFILHLLVNMGLTEGMRFASTVRHYACLVKRRGRKAFGRIE